MDATHCLVVCICPTPGCGQRIRVSIGRFPGGVNHRGGFVIECASCHRMSHIPVANPDDLSSVESGGRVVTTWDDDIENSREEALAASNLSEADLLSDSILVIPSQEPDDPLFELGDRAIYQCAQCGRNLETQAYSELHKALTAVNRAISDFISGPYLKGYTAKPDAIEVKLNVACDCAAHSLSFYRSFSERDHHVRTALGFELAGPEDPGMLSDIDGIYSRNECIEIFKKLLLRWRAHNQIVMLVVPFIGFDYPNREEDKLELWNMVLGYTNPARTLLVTRRKTYNSFRETVAKHGFDLAVLKKYGLLAHMLESLDEKKAVFKTDSHAKFYAAVGPQTTEVLSGSFNIHTGEYVENLLFKTYPSATFVSRYLLPLGVLFDFAEVGKVRDVLMLDVEDGAVLRTRCEKV